MTTKYRTAWTFAVTSAALSGQTGLSVIDSNRRHYFHSVARIGQQVASALAYVTLSGFDRLQLGFLADRVVATAGPFWGRHQRSVALAAISTAPQATRTDVAAGIGSYLERVRHPALLVLVSDLLSPTAAAGLRRMASGRHEVTIIHLLSPDELEAIFAGREPLANPALADRFASFIEGVAARYSGV